MAQSIPEITPPLAVACKISPAFIVNAPFLEEPIGSTPSTKLQILEPAALNLTESPGLL